MSTKEYQIDQLPHFTWDNCGNLPKNQVVVIDGTVVETDENGFICAGLREDATEVITPEDMSGPYHLEIDEEGNILNHPEGAFPPVDENFQPIKK